MHKFKRVFMETKNYKQPQFLTIDGSMLEGGGQVIQNLNISIIVVQNDIGTFIFIENANNH